MSFDFVENFTLQLPDFSEFDSSFSEAFSSKNGLIIEVAAIHEGLTSNYNNYSAAELEKALVSWVEPYPKPIIMNHDLNTEAIGRVMAAKMDKEADGTPYVRLQVAITDPIAAQKVLDKRYLTGSVGGRAQKAVCSITGEDLAKEDGSGRPKVLKYKKGQVYKGKLSFVDMQDISFHEYSFVNQPADQKSTVRTLHSGDEAITGTDGWVAKSSAFVISMESEEIYNIEGHKSVLEDMKKKESRPFYLQLKGAFLTALAVHESENDVNNSKSLLSSEDFETPNSEENCSMETDGLKEEDILAVANGLSEDLSTIAAASTDEVAEDALLESEEEAAAEQEVASEEGGAEEGETAVVAADEASDTVSSSGAEESEVHNDVDSDETVSEEEASADQADEVQEESVEKDDLSPKVEELEQAIEQLNAKVNLLESENNKLKQALHMTLVERVVDTKITLGLETLEDRARLVTEHQGRTASSLADSLRDLAKVPAAKTRVGSMPEVAAESDVALGAEENVTTEGVVEVSDEAPVTAQFEELLVDVFMGRRKL